MNRREGRSQIPDVGPIKNFFTLSPWEHFLAVYTLIVFPMLKNNWWILLKLLCSEKENHQLLNAIWSIAIKRHRFFILRPLEFEKNLSGKKNRLGLIKSYDHDYFIQCKPPARLYNYLCSCAPTWEDKSSYNIFLFTVSKTF